ncbi:MAG: hypothetical protein HC906_02705 [Bacteroidales bacterium]|nr:hypothetical protein [Bacteroidales bacterium]
MNSKTNYKKKPRETKEYENYRNPTPRMLEQIIASKPDYWLWSHKRWKFKRKEIEEKQKQRHDKNSHSYSELER